MSMKRMIKSTNGKQLVPLLLGITILYQLAYNAVLFDSLPNDSECSAAGSIGGGSSQYCQEVEVFRSWKDEDVSHLLKRTEPAPIEQDHWDLIEFGRQVSSVNLTSSAKNDSVDAAHDATGQTNTSSAGRKRLALNETQIAANLEGHLSLLVTTVNETAMSNAGLGHMPSAAPATRTSSVFLEKRSTQLHWSSVVAWSKSSSNFLANKAPIVVPPALIVSRGQVRHLHWAGSIPKVACVTPISGSRHAKARMMYFIDNFRLQDYEGSRQLVLVYHYLDEIAAKLAHSYADGTYIKAVAAHGNGTFPSTAALRYGAWSSDADVIARWDFDEWHDPSQLSMQIRAMALFSRPACVLRPVAKSSDSKLGEKEPTLGFSLVGERSWMKLHWHPYVKDEDDALKSSQQDRIVELDMKTSNFLRTNDDDVKSSEEGDRGNANGKEDWSVSGCIDLDNSSKIDTISHNLEETIGANMGQEMSKSFHKLMTRRHDITLKLQLLCLQNTNERDSKKHEFTRKHVVEMLNIRAELDKHIAATAAIFLSSSD